MLTIWNLDLQYYYYYYHITTKFVLKPVNIIICKISFYSVFIKSKSIIATFNRYKNHSTRD